MKLFNTLGRQEQTFKSLQENKVKIYTCGPTVYDYQHIGNYSGYIYWDILARLFRAKGYKVNRVMNITDVGHLASDADEGEDKLEKGAQREGKTAREVADFYTADFMRSMDLLNLVKPDTYAKATDYIKQQIEMIEILLGRGFAYPTKQAIYFDVAKLGDYGKLTGQSLSEKEVGARAEVVTDADKRAPQDFALWFFRVGRFAEHEMHWPSPWGDGFPGWHIECSAIVHAALGDPIDIHTGGVDHIGTHHTNEIAQTEAAFDHRLANFWLHNNHMLVDGQKISKSKSNGFTLADLAKRGFSPMDFKILVLQSHYRSQSNFSWEALEAARARLQNLYAWADLVHQSNKSNQALTLDAQDLMHEIEDDLRAYKAILLIEAVLDRPPGLELLSSIDQLLGLNLSGRPDISAEQKQLIADREEARRQQDWQTSDSIRDKLLAAGIGLRDTATASIWYRL